MLARVERGRKANIDLQHEARLGIRVRPAHACARIVSQNKMTRQCVAARDRVRTTGTWRLHSPMLATSRPRPFLCPRESSPGSARPGKRVGWAASARPERARQGERMRQENEDCNVVIMSRSEPLGKRNQGARDPLPSLPSSRKSWQKCGLQPALQRVAALTLREASRPQHS